MTYCLGLLVTEGLVLLADGRITAGSQVSNARKATRHGPEGAQIAIMTSGLRSLRDKTLAFFDRTQRKRFPNGHGSMLEAIDSYCQSLREVEEQDRGALEKSDLHFNLHAIVAGQLEDDPEPALFLIYPEANWIAVDRRTPYLSIGSVAYGKPILDRALRYETPMENALKLAYLSFDSTRFSSADVGYPVDMMTFAASDRRWREVQYDYEDLVAQRTWWNEHITKLAAEMPAGPWIESLLPSADARRLALVRDE
ncbi:MAG: peptidase [Tistlia sp.]|uniref:peptidase n=1 Tax=Tistlia sp. TaxID=3057121 RepID=UPI0034A329CD